MDKIEEAAREAEAERVPFVPMYIVVTLKQTTKKRYDDMRKSEHIATSNKSCFLIDDGDNRLMFVAEDDKYYEGVFSPTYDTEWLKGRVTTGVEVRTTITFTKSTAQDK